MSVAIQFKFPELDKKIIAAKDEINLFIAAMMQTNRGMMFDGEGAYNGHPRWAPLKFRFGHILKLSGTLSRSMGPMSKGGHPTYGPGTIIKFSGDVITIGSSLSYARLMNDGTTKMPGGVMKAPPGQAFAIPIPSGKEIDKGAKHELSKKGGQSVKDILAKADHLKALRKKSSGKKQFQTKIERLEAQISIAHKAGNHKKRDELKEKHDRWMKAFQNSPKNQRVIFRKTVRIPARPFDEWNEADQAELEAALVNKLIEVLNR